MFRIRRYAIGIAKVTRDNAYVCVYVCCVHVFAVAFNSCV